VVGGAFATNRSGKYWPLAYMFPRGLAAFLSPYWANSAGWGGFLGCTLFTSYTPGLLQFAEAVVDTASFRVLSILLICNVSGCRTMLNTH